MLCFILSDDTLKLCLQKNDYHYRILVTTTKNRGFQTNDIDLSKGAKEGKQGNY